MEGLSQDSLAVVFRLMPVKEKLRLLSLSSDCKVAIEIALKKQKVLGNEDPIASRCSDKRHKIKTTDLVPHPFHNRVQSKEQLINYTINVLRLCPNVQVLRLFIQHRPLSTSYGELFKAIVDLYGDKLQCFTITTVPRTFARVTLPEETMSTLNEYEALITPLSTLKHLSVALISDDHLGVFLEKNRDIQILEVGRLQGSGECFQKLPPSLKQFKLPIQTAAGFVNIVKSPAMETIEVLEIRANVTGLRLNQSLNFKALKEVRLRGRGTGFTAAHFKGLSNSHKLEILDVQHFSCVRNFVDSDFKDIFAKCTMLREIVLHNDAITDQFFEYLAKCKSLQILEICTFQIVAPVQFTDVALSHLKGLHNLTTLVMEYFGAVMSVSEAGLLELLTSCRRLERLVIKRSSLAMISPATRTILMELVNQREIEGKKYRFELEHDIVDGNIAAGELRSVTKFLMLNM